MVGPHMNFNQLKIVCYLESVLLALLNASIVIYQVGV